MKKLELWPVIHVTNPDRAIVDARMCFDVGCDGVWFIQMQGHDYILFPLLDRVRNEVDNKFPVGANFLSMTSVGALSKSAELGFDATWADNCGVHSSGCSEIAYQTSNVLKAYPGHKFFGSVAFKYQKEDKDPRTAALLAHNYGFIPTTSGSGTGSAPEWGKLREMFDGGKGQLAVASGIDVYNIEHLAPYMTHAFVATSISNDQDRIDLKKLTELKDKIDSL